MRNARRPQDDAIREAIYCIAVGIRMGHGRSVPRVHSHRREFHSYRALGICGRLCPRPLPEMMRRQSWLMVGLLSLLLVLFLRKVKVTHHPLDYWQCEHHYWLLSHVQLLWGCHATDNPVSNQAVLNMQFEKYKQNTGMVLSMIPAQGDAYEITGCPEAFLVNASTNQRLESVEAFRMSPSDPWQRCED